MQLLYQPSSPEAFGAFPESVRPVRVFQLQAFDGRGKASTPDILRPLLLQVPIPKDVRDPGRLMLMHYDGSTRQWRNLLTSWDKGNSLLFTRINRFGGYALAQVPSPFPEPKSVQR
jgi:hypothetical protein